MAIFDFKKDLQEYTGQADSPDTIGGTKKTSGVLNSLIGQSPVKATFSFEDDIKEYETLSKGPGGAALDDAIVIENNNRAEAARKANEKQQQQNDQDEITVEEQRRQLEQQKAVERATQGLPDPRDSNQVNAYLAPDILKPTQNIEIDYENDPLATKEITAVPEGTVGGHCGVYAEHVVKLEDGRSWVVGDSINQKKDSIERYRQAGAAFKPGEDAPQVGNAIIQDTGSPWGHVAVINDIAEDGTATITESNWNWDKRVTHSRKMRLDDPSIVGFIRTQ